MDHWLNACAVPNTAMKSDGSQASRQPSKPAPALPVMGLNPSAKVWDTQHSHTSLQSGSPNLATGSLMMDPGSGTTSGHPLFSAAGRHSSHASLGSMEFRRTHRPARPALAADREKPSYSVDLLEYLCSSIEQLSSCLEDMNRTQGLPMSSERRSSTFTPHVRTSVRTLGLGLGSTGVSSPLPEQSSTGRNSQTLPSQGLSSQLGGSGNSRFQVVKANNAIANSGANSAANSVAESAATDNTSWVFRCSTRMVDKQWPVSIAIRSGLEDNGQEVNKEKVRQMMERALKESKKDHLRKRWKGRRELGCVEKNVLSMKDPNSKFVRIVDMVSMLALVNDCLVTPYALAWDLSNSFFLSSIAMFSAMYWTFFLCLKFRTGFYKDGELQMSQWNIIKRYVRTTFFIDLTLTSLDWAVVFMPSASTDRNVRMIKTLRTAKIFRLARIWELVETVVDQYAPEGTSSKLVIRMGQVMISTLIFTHIMACAWFSVGKDGTADTHVTWLETFMPSTRNIKTYEYATCFHWTLAQLTLGSVDIYPMNSLERLFNISLLFAGIVFNATIVSLISSQAVEFIANRRDQNLKIQLLKRFLEQHKVDTKLAARVQRQVLDRIRSADALISEDAVQALTLVSTTLKSQLLYETRLPHMVGHALFRVWYETDEHALKALCENAVSFEIYKSHDCVFLPGEQAEGMVQIADGTLRYTQDPETSREADNVDVVCRKGDTLCEAGLWSMWTHVGKMEAMRTCELVGILAAEMIHVLNAFPLIGHITRQYGRAFHLRITCARPPFSRWPNDVEVPHTNASDLLAQDIGLELLRRERVKENGPVASMTDDDFQELVSEVEREKCAIEANVDGTLERIVALVAVRVERAQDSRILAEVGKFDMNKQVVTPSCALPGAKRPRGELPHQTYDRLLFTDLSFIASGLITQSSKTEVEIKESQHFGLLTKYLRTVQHASIKADFEFPDIAQVVQELPAPETPSLSPSSRGGGVRRDRSRRLSAPSMGLASSSTRHTETTDQEEPLDDMSEEPILIHECGGGRIKLYCWLHERTFNFLSRSDSGKQLLDKWVRSMDIMGALTAFRNEGESQQSFTASPSQSQVVVEFAPPPQQPLMGGDMDRQQSGGQAVRISLPPDDATIPPIQDSIKQWSNQLSPRFESL